MFRKIVSQLSFSPALVGQLGFYAKRLKQEQSTRRLGLVFVTLALVVQSLVVFQPPEAANAANDTDMVYGGLGLGSKRSLDNFMRPYDANTRNLRDAMDQVGITREEILATKFGTFKVGNKYSWGFSPRFSAKQGEQKVAITKNGERVKDMYARPLKLFNGANATIYAYIGHSKAVGWFAIMQSCGNLVTDIIPESPEPEPAEIILSKTGVNASQGNVTAQSVTARSNDKIVFTLTAKNEGGTPAVVSFKDHLSDTLEYAEILDAGGGTFDKDTMYLSWPDTVINPGKEQSRTFSVQLLSSIPSTPQGVSYQGSYDCSIVNTFGESVIFDVDCPTPKVVENVVKELPQTGPAENFIFSGVVLALVVYFFLRSKQLNKEVRLVRRDLNAGTI